MKKVNEEVLRAVADKLMFDITDEQCQSLLIEFNTILKQMELIGEIPNIDDYSPMTFPFDVTSSYLREDIPSKPLDKKEALKNAKDVKDGQIRLPKVVG